MSEREEVVLCGASAYNKKFYLNQDFKGLPDSIKDEYGNLEFRTSSDENDLLYDEIGCGLKIRELQRTKEELLRALEMYYKVLYIGVDETEM